VPPMGPPNRGQPAPSPGDGAWPAPGGTPAQARELRARGLRTIRRLLAAGRVVMDRKGYHAARVDDIVKEADTSHGTFYLYFASKEELFHALARETAVELETVAGSLGEVTGGPEGWHELRAWLARFVDAYDRHSPVIRAWTEIEVGTTELGRLGGDVLAGFSAVLADRTRAVSTPDLDVDTAAVALVAMVERTVYFGATGQTDRPRDSLLDTLADVIHGSLFADAPHGVLTDHVSRPAG
jgi:AcrR family transcriptional regulator